MRIAHVITRLIVGGAQENTVASAVGLQRFPDFQVELISGITAGTEGSLEPLVSQSGLPLTIVDNLVRPVHPWRDWRALKQLERHFRRTRPDLVHTHSGKAGILGRLAARRAGVPLIVHTIHGPSFGPFQGRIANLLFRTAEQKAGRCTDHFAAVSQAMIDLYRSAGIGRWENYSRVLSGFELGPFVAATNDLELRRRLGLQPDDFVLGTIARLAPLKGHDDLIDLLSELRLACRHVRLLWVGDGPWRSRLLDRLEKAGLAECVCLTGLVPPDQIHRYVGIMDALVHPSYREGLPRALPQALAAARPVVAYDCDGAREVCLEGETGFLVRPGDRVGVVTAVSRLVNDVALRGKLGRRGQGLVLEQFSVERMVNELRSLYLSLAKRANVGVESMPSTQRNENGGPR